MGETHFLAKAIGRDVVNITIGGRFANLDPSLADAPFDIGIDKSKSNASVAGQVSLACLAILLDGIQQLQSDLILGCVHGMNGTERQRQSQSIVRAMARKSRWKQGRLNATRIVDLSTPQTPYLDHA